jgi:hypothetical protein
VRTFGFFLVVHFLLRNELNELKVKS